MGFNNRGDGHRNNCLSLSRSPEFLRGSSKGNLAQLDRIHSLADVQHFAGFLLYNEDRHPCFSVDLGHLLSSSFADLCSSCCEFYEHFELLSMIFDQVAFGNEGMKVLPEALLSQGPEHVREGDAFLMRIPGRRGEGALHRSLFGEPETGERVEEHGHGRGAQDGLFAPALRRLREAEVSFGIVKGHLKCPSAGIPGEHLGRGGLHCGAVECLRGAPAGQRLEGDDPQETPASCLIPERGAVSKRC